MTASADIHVGFMPLMDAAILIVAREMGFAEDEGIGLHLHRETSWANIRDRMAVGHFDAAHMLAPMPVANALNLTPMPTDLIVPMALGLGGNAITVSQILFQELFTSDLLDGFDANSAGKAMRNAVQRRQRSAEKKLCFGVVHPHSSHHYDLRYWLSASGISPSVDMDIVVVPPSLMPDALVSGQLDGYCAGEPWNSVATERGIGQVLTTKAHIWRSSPDKVLAVSANLASDEQAKLHALIRSLVRAAQWCQDSGNLDDLAQLLSRSEYVSVSADILKHSLSGKFTQLDGAASSDPAFFIPYERAANFPWQSHALWFYSQMVRWGHVKYDVAKVDIINRIWRPDIYRSVVEAVGLAVPAANAKVEGSLSSSVPVGVGKGALTLGPDGFFDGEVFDPELLERYIRRQMPLD